MHQKKLQGSMLILVPISIFLIVALLNIFHRGIWTDESYTMALLMGNFEPSFPTAIFKAEVFQSTFSSLAPPSKVFRELLEADTHPPVYFATTYIWSVIFGKTLISLRFASLTFGLIACWGFYDLVKRYAPDIATLSTTFLVFSSSFIHYATEARMYIFSLAFLFLFASFITRSFNSSAYTKRILWAALSGGMASAAFLTNYLILFPLVGIYLWAFLTKKNRRLCIISGVVTSILALMWVPYLIGHHLEARVDQALGWEGWLPTITMILRDAFQTLYAPANVAYPTLLHWIGRLTLCVLLFRGTMTLVQSKRPFEENHIAVLSILVIASTVSGVILLNYMFNKHLNEPRYVLPAVMGLSIICALGIQSLKKRFKPLWLATGGVAVMILLSAANFGYTTSHFFGKTIYREFALSISEYTKGQDLVIAGTGHGSANTSALLYELPTGTDVLVLTPDLSPDSIIEKASAYDRIWLVSVGERTASLEKKLAQKSMGERLVTKKLYHITLYQRDVTKT